MAAGPVIHAVALRRNREFTALWSGQAASAFGASISGLAYPLLALDLTGSAAWAGVLAGALMATAFLLRLPAGSSRIGSTGAD